MFGTQVNNSRSTAFMLRKCVNNVDVCFENNMSHAYNCILYLFSIIVKSCISFICNRASNQNITLLFLPFFDSCIVMYSNDDITT